MQSSQRLRHSLLPDPRSVFALGAAIAVACGGDTTDSRPESDGPDGAAESEAGPEISEVPALLAGVLCDTLTECIGPLFAVYLKEDCATLTTERVEQAGFSQIEAKITAGSVEYHPGSVEACLDALAARSCSDVLQRYEEECERALTGTVELGGACDIDEECAGDAICATEDSCPGECVDRRGAGQRCADDDDCADFLVCSDDTELCVTPAAEGEACGGGVEPECALGLFCVGEDDEEGTPGSCATTEEAFRAASSETCSFTVGPLCADGRSCIFNPLPTDGPLTGSCGEDAEAGGDCYLAVPDMCPQGQFCPIDFAALVVGTPGTCTPLPEAGESCGADISGEACAAYTVCVEGVCQPLQDLGENCSINAQCYSENCSDGGCVPGDNCG